MNGYSLSENWLLLIAFICAFFAAIAIVAHIVEDVIPRNKRRIQDFFRKLKGGFYEP